MLMRIRNKRSEYTGSKKKFRFVYREISDASYRKLCIQVGDKSEHILKNYHSDLFCIVVM